MRKKRDFDYQQYLASREWAVRREAVRERAGGYCERCWLVPMRATHHQTYANIGAEPLEDLLGVCGPCHEFLSGKSDFDPRVNLEPVFYDHISVNLAAAMLASVRTDWDRAIDPIPHDYYLKFESSEARMVAAAFLEAAPGSPMHGSIGAFL